ncbi:MAG TPA: hypothetical protein VIR16_11560 [Candidatus Limnocylindrales bacterium]
MLLHFEFHIADIRERERRLRIAAEHHRLFGLAGRGLRLRLGQLLMQLGRLVGGEAVGPASLGARATTAPLG